MKHMDIAFGFACHIYRILALGIAGTHRQLCSAYYKYRHAGGKKDFFNWLAHQALQIYLLDSSHVQNTSILDNVVDSMFGQNQKNYCFSRCHFLYIKQGGGRL